MRQGLAVLFALSALSMATSAPAEGDPNPAVQAAKKRWADSPHGPMLERILPPAMDVRELPEKDSEGARLAVRYCVQCHNLPNPAMHHAEKWQKVVDRMVVRMRGNGNMGRLMADLMAGVAAPGDGEVRILVAYLQRNAQRALDPKRYPDVFEPEAEPFRLACQQCHILPDPKRYSATEWPGVVKRMEYNMLWMNRVVGSHPVKGEPQLRIEAINAYLVRHARNP